jgi:hypothetical protein
MPQTHPLTPPEELLEQWYWTAKSGNWQNALALAYRAGADQELEACCEWLKDFPHFVGIEEQLRAARRPKPPSLKEQAFKALGPEPLPVTAPMGDTILNKNIIERHRLLHRALEALPND